LGLSEETAKAIGAERAAQIRVFRLLHHLGQQLHFLADHMYREDGITSQQAMLLGVVGALGEPSLTQTAAAFATSHQNVKQIANALVRKGFLEMKPDPEDARVSRLVATAKSRRYFAARDKDDFDRIAVWFSALSKKEVVDLQDLLLTLHESVIGAVKDAKADRG
jgi:DNA-binding MarR family transcriptional regulator